MKQTLYALLFLTLLACLNVQAPAQEVTAQKLDAPIQAQPQSVTEAPADLGQKLAGWQKAVDAVDARLNAGPMTPASIAEIKDHLKEIRNLAGADMKLADSALKAQNDLLTALGPAPAKDSAIEEGKEVRKQRDEISAAISRIDAQSKQASLLLARIDKMNESLGKQTTDIRKTELFQKTGYLLTPAVLHAASLEAGDYISSFHFSRTAVSYLIASAFMIWIVFMGLPRMREWVAQRQVFRAKPRGRGLYFQILLAAFLLLGHRFNIFGIAAHPLLSDMVKLVLACWLSSTLFIFLSGLSFELPEGMSEEEAGMPVGFLGLLLSVLKLAVLALLPAAVLGYAQLAAYVALNIAGSIGAVVLSVALRSGLVAFSTRLAKAFGVERILSPLAIAFLEPFLAAISLLVAGTFWGVTTEDLKDWVDHLSSGITIGSIKLDFSDAGAAIAVFFALYILTKAVQLFLSKRLFPQTHMDRGVQDAVYTLIGYIGVSIALLTGLSTLGLDMSKLAIVAGALSVGIGFGLQTIVNNFVSGLILLFERPIRVGDYVKIGAEQGRVRRIRVRATELETTQAGSIIVPNSKLISDNVTNWTLESRSVRLEIVLVVNNAADTEAVKNLLLKAAAEHPTVRKRPEPQVLFTNFTATAKEFELRCFTRDIADRPQVASDLRFAIDKAFKDQGIARV